MSDTAPEFVCGSVQILCCACSKVGLGFSNGRDQCVEDFGTTINIAFEPVIDWRSGIAELGLFSRGRYVKITPASYEIRVSLD
jgi:hypothetical protein